MASVRGKRVGSRVQGLAVGVAVAISAIYTLLFIPLVPLSFIALIVWGMGMLSLISRSTRWHRHGW